MARRATTMMTLTTLCFACTGDVGDGEGEVTSQGRLYPGPCSIWKSSELEPEPVKTWEATYDDQGRRLTLETFSRDPLYGLGSFERYEYDDQGRLVRQERDEDGDGVLDFQRRCLQWASSQCALSEEVDDDGMTTRWGNEYDWRGRVAVSRVDDGADGVWDVVTRKSYDGDMEWPASSVAQSDDGAWGWDTMWSADRRTRTTVHWSGLTEDGERIESWRAIERFNQHGDTLSVGHVVPGEAFVLTQAYVYDDASRKVRERFWPYGELVRESTFRYEEDGGWVETRHRWWDEDHFTRSVTRFNSRGVDVFHESDDMDDGTIDGRTIKDDEGRVLLNEYGLDEDGEYTYRRVHAYDAFGNKTKETFTSPHDVYVSEYRYDCFAD